MPIVGELTVLETVVRILLALGTSAIVGLERELAYQPAGLRTHVLLGLGAVLFTIGGVEIMDAAPSRVAGQVASGVGFLGAGAILQERLRVRGLTTAASLWVTAALGVAAGAGAYLAVGTVTVTALAVLVALKWVEREFFPRQRGQALAVDLAGGVGIRRSLSEVERIAGPVELRQIERMPEGGQRLLGHVRLSGAQDLVDIAEDLRALPDVTGVDISR